LATNNEKQTDITYTSITRNRNRPIN